MIYRVGRAVAMVGALASFAGASAGCLYDSRWGDDKKLQRARAAQAQSQATLETAPPAGPAARNAAAPVKKRTFRVRALVTRSFAATVVESSKHIREMLDDASDVLEPAMGARFELEAVRDWDLARDDDLQSAIVAARQVDPGADVDWVVGFVGALPRASRSFHDVGRGEIPGKHIVVRAPSSAELHDAVDREYDELSDEEKHAIRKGRKRHRAVAVFLHEVGHTLGVIHERSPKSIMYPQYSPRGSTFGPDAVRIMTASIDDRGPKTAQEAAKLYRDLAASLKQAPEGVFFEAERKTTIAQLEALASRNESRNDASAQTAQPDASAAPAIPETPELSAEHRASFVKASEAFARADYVVAWETAKPLFAPYPDSFAVQDLRCKTASFVMSWPAARIECERLIKLSK